MKKYSVWFGDVWMNTYDAWSADHAVSQCNDQFGQDNNYQAKEV